MESPSYAYTVDPAVISNVSESVTAVGDWRTSHNPLPLAAWAVLGIMGAQGASAAAAAVDVAVANASQAVQAARFVLPQWPISSRLAIDEIADPEFQVPENRTRVVSGRVVRIDRVELRPSFD